MPIGLPAFDEKADKSMILLLKWWCPEADYDNLINSMTYGKVGQ